MPSLRTERICISQLQTRKTDLAWCAGIIDGEGCITISRGGRARKYLNLRLFVKMCDQTTIQLTKPKQAKILIRTVERMIKIPVRGGRYDTKEILWQDKIITTIRKLNGRGII